jgi:hypothetical protein
MWFRIKKSKKPQQANESAEVNERIKQEVDAMQNETRQTKADIPVYESFMNPFPARFAVFVLIGILIGSGITWLIMPNRHNLDSNMLSGTLSATSKLGISYVSGTTSLKVVPYQIDHIHYLNFFVDTRSEIQFDVTFNASDVVLRKADYVETDGVQSMNMNFGNLNFIASRRATFQVILEKASTMPATVDVTATQNGAIIARRQLLIE